MTVTDPFIGIDQVVLQRVTESFGDAFATASALSHVNLAHDARVSPEAFAAGICKAHCFGLASAVISTGQIGQDPVALAEALGAMLVGMVRLSGEFGRI